MKSKNELYNFINKSYLQGKHESYLAGTNDLWYFPTSDWIYLSLCRKLKESDEELHNFILINKKTCYVFKLLLDNVDLPENLRNEIILSLASI
jgi:hypothetical protein